MMNHGPGDPNAMQEELGLFSKYQTSSSLSDQPRCSENGEDKVEQRGIESPIT